MVNIETLVQEFEQYVQENGLSKQEATKALWLFCDEAEHGRRILEDRNLEQNFRSALRDNGWGVSDGTLLSNDGFQTSLGDILRA